MSAPGTIPTEITYQHYAMQQFIIDNIDMILGSWWIIFFGILAMLIGRFMIYTPYKNRHIIKTESDYLVDSRSGDGSISGINWFFYREINNDIALRLFGGAVLLGFLFTFSGWQMDTSTTLNAIKNHTVSCWPFFKSCGDYIFLETLPHGYSQTIVYMVMFGFIFLAAYGLLASKAGLSHLCIGILFIAKMYFVLVNYDFNGNYDYYHNAFTFVYLFLPYKRFFGSLCVAFFYFLSTATKIHEGWLAGTYFSTLRTGLPIFPDEMLPVWTGIVIFMEMVGVWFLFSRHKILQRLAAAFFIFFHLYSGILVGYFYPTVVLPSVIIFFGPLFKPFKYVPFNPRAFIGWAFIGLLFMTQMISHLIPGDEKYTMEGNFYGLYMFEANHQCQASITHEELGVIYEEYTTNARARCDTYEFWFKYKNKYCGKKDNGKYGFIVHHSINGGPFYEIVNEPNLCALEYKPFGKNEWIKDPKDAEIIGLGAEKNYYR